MHLSPSSIITYTIVGLLTVYLGFLASLEVSYESNPTPTKEPEKIPATGTPYEVNFGAQRANNERREEIFDFADLGSRTFQMFQNRKLQSGETGEVCMIQTDIPPVQSNGYNGHWVSMSGGFKCDNTCSNMYELFAYKDGKIYSVRYKKGTDDGQIRTNDMTTAYRDDFVLTYNAQNCGYNSQKACLQPELPQSAEPSDRDTQRWKYDRSKRWVYTTYDNKKMCLENSQEWHGGSAISECKADNVNQQIRVITCEAPYERFEGQWELTNREQTTRSDTQEFCSSSSFTNDFSVALTESTSTTDTSTTSSTSQLSVGFKIKGVGIGAEASTTQEQSHSVTKETSATQQWSQSVSSSRQSCNSQTKEVSCNAASQCDINDFVYQWVTVGYRKDGIQVRAPECQVVCVSSAGGGRSGFQTDHTPKCPYASCNLWEGCQCCNDIEWMNRKNELQLCPKQCLFPVANQYTATFDECVAALAGTACTKVPMNSLAACHAEQCSGCEGKKFEGGHLCSSHAQCVSGVCMPVDRVGVRYIRKCAPF